MKMKGAAAGQSLSANKSYLTIGLRHLILSYKQQILFTVWIDLRDRCRCLGFADLLANAADRPAGGIVGGYGTYTPYRVRSEPLIVCDREPERHRTPELVRRQTASGALRHATFQETIFRSCTVSRTDFRYRQVRP